MEPIAFLFLMLACHSAVMFVIGTIRIFLSWRFLMSAPRDEIIRMMVAEEIELEEAKQLSTSLGDHFIAEWRAANKRHFMQGMFCFDGPVKYLGMTRKPTPQEVLQRALRLHGDT